jgi:hypothetical protein
MLRKQLEIPPAAKALARDMQGFPQVIKLHRQQVMEKRQ